MKLIYLIVSVLAFAGGLFFLILKMPYSTCFSDVIYAAMLVLLMLIGAVGVAINWEVIVLKK